MLKQLEPKFVDGVPEKIENGVLYISIRFKTTSHLCACGCGERVVAKLSPNDWSLLYNGSDVTLAPSIGNWSFDCRSHYFVRKNCIVWARDMSDEQIANGREANARRKKVVLEPKPLRSPQNVSSDWNPEVVRSRQEAIPQPKRLGVIARLWLWIKG